MTYSIPELVTERLRLRAPKLADLPRLTDFYASERSHLVGGPLDARQAARALSAVFGGWALRGAGMWYIADRDTDAFLGWTGYIFGPGWDEPELGWTVMDEAEGKGIAFEASKAARDKLAEMGHTGLISYIRATNTRSEALATRLGAAHERDSEFLGIPVQVWRHPKSLREVA
jgi:RimJ/RimL family protein N-acetyltransferase